MAGIDEEMVLFNSVTPQAANVADIDRGHRLLDLIAPDDVGSRVAVLTRLGSLYLENRVLDPLQSVDYASSCYGEVLGIANDRENVEWLVCGFSGSANVLSRRYQLTRDPDVLANAEQTFRDLIACCEKAGLSDHALRFRMNYATLLKDAVHGDRFDNLDRAIGLLREVAEQFSQPVRGAAFDPDRYARALYNLGATLLTQAEEPHVRSMNIDEAVAVLREALVHRPADRDITGRIRTLRALAVAYPEWSGADSTAHAQHLADAANAEADALEQQGVVPRKAAWAILAQQRSALYWDIDEMAESPDGRANVEQAIEIHLRNIELIPSDTLPFLWAEWVGGFARLAGRIGIEYSSVEYLNRSLAAFQNALDAVPVERDPRLCLVLNRELGRVCHECQQWERSLEANRRATDIGLVLCDAAGTNVSRANELEEVTRAIHFAVFAAAQLNRPGEAAELAEIGRARWLDDALRAAAIRRSDASAETKAAVDRAQAAVLELERRELDLMGQGAGGMAQRLQDALGLPFGGPLKIRVTSDLKGQEARRSNDLVKLRSELQKAHAQLNDLLDEVSSTSADILPRRPRSDQIQKIAESAGLTIVYVLATTWGSTAIFVGKTVEILPLPGIDRTTVRQLLYGDKGYVSLASEDSGCHLEESLKAIGEAIDQSIIAPITEWGCRNDVDSLAIVGIGDVGLLPFQVSTVPAGLSIRLLPSARMLDLSLARKAEDRGDATRFLTVSDPASDGFRRLPFSRVESLVLRGAFEKTGAMTHALLDSVTLAHLEALLQDATHLHLACHGTFRPFSPLNSAIHLAGDEVLPVESLLRPALKLAGAKLVILSACNSASEEFWRTPDEAIGFPAVVLAAGAGNSRCSAMGGQRCRDISADATVQQGAARKEI